MSVHLKIRSAARQTLLTVAGLPAQKFWEGEVFSSTRGVPFLTEMVRPISSVVRGVGASPAEAHTIVLVWTLSYPPGQGTKDIETAVAALLAAFRPGQSLAYEDQTAVIRQRERSSLRQDPDWISCTVTVTVVAYTFG